MKIAKSRGFTIVELLMVIVIIGILVTTVMLTFTGITQRVANGSRYDELSEWKKVFLVYKTTNGSWPPSMAQDTEYCLGGGYPIGAGGVPRCHNYQSSGATQSPDYAVLQSDNATLMNDLYTISRPTQGDRAPMNGIVGPYVAMKADGSGNLYVRLTMTQYGTTCPNGSQLYWSDPPSNRSTCIIEIY